MNNYNITNVHVHEYKPVHPVLGIVGGILKGSSLLLLFFCGIYSGLQFIGVVFGPDILSGDLAVFNSVTNLVSFTDSIGFRFFGIIMKGLTNFSQALINHYPKVVEFFDNLFNGTFVSDFLNKLKDILLSIF